MPQYVNFTLPDVGEGLTEADIVEWKVAVGDQVRVNQDIVEIETAKSLVDLPSPHTGVVTELLAEVGQTVPVGEAIIVIDIDPDGEPAGTTDDGRTPRAEPADDGASHPSGSADDGRTRQADAAADGDAHPGEAGIGGGVQPAGTANDGGAHHTRGAGGDAHPGDAGTDGAPGAGTQSDETSGDVLVGYGTKGVRPRRRRRAVPAASPQVSATQAPAAPAREASSSAASAPSPAASPAPAVPEASGPDGLSAPASAPVRSAPRASAADASSASSGTASAAPPATGVLAKPPVRKLAKDLGIDLTRVPATGPGGIVTRADVLAAHAQEEPRELATYPGEPWLDGGTVSDDGRQTRVPVRSVRRRTAEAMVASAFTAPHVTVFTTVDVSRTMKLVRRLRSDPEFADVRVTPLLVAAKALILAIRRNPAISAAWDEQAQEIVYKHYINLGIAAATPRGLVVPNIKDAHRMSLHELAGALGDLTATARAGKTTPAAMTDGTVTITNVGVFGIDTGTPILNPGESAILAFGAISKRPWVHKGKLKPRWVTQLALSFDHRLVDGELGSRVLADVARVMEDPTQALVWG